MNLFLAILACISDLIAPYFIILVLLGNHAKEYNVTYVTLSKCNEVKSLFGITLLIQFIILTLVVEALLCTIFIDHKPIGTLADALSTAAELILIFEFICGVIFIANESVSVTNRLGKELREQHKQSIKF